LGEVADRVVGLTCGVPPGVPRPALDGPAAVAEHFARFRAKEGVAGPALPAYRRFKEKPEGWPGELGERGDRSVRVEHDLAYYRNHAAPPLLGASQELGARIGHRGAART